MGEMIEFPSNGSTAGGYLAVPEGGSGPGVVVIHYHADAAEDSWHRIFTFFGEHLGAESASGG